MGTRRRVSAWQGARRALSTALLVVGLVAVAPPAGACACGGVVDGPADESSVSAETAVLQWDGTTQTLVLELETLSTAPEMGLLLPTPTPAEVTLADPEIFRELDEITAPRAVVSEYRWWPELGLGGTGDSAGGGAPGVEVLDQVRLGPLDVATLAAHDTAALDAWLAEHGFELPASVRGALAPYVAEGWSFVAARLAPEAASTFDGTLQPLRVTFASSSLVHPMRMSVVAEDAQRTRTYVLADHRMDRADATADLAAPTVRFAGRVPPGSVESPELAELLAAGDYVTAHEQSFTDPATQIVSDFTFVPAPSDVARSPTYAVVADKRVGPFFAGPVLAFGGILVLSGLLVWGSRRHHAPVRVVAPRPARA
jgi:hypothetical protein